jgi:capsular polysaccharide biosynthesis protein
MPIPKECATLETPVLFLSILSDHWGHFLTESTSRLWARLTYPDLNNIGGFFSYMWNDDLDSKYARFLSCFNLFMGDNIFSANIPVKLKKCFIPIASFSNRGEAYCTHRSVFEHVSRQVLRKTHIETPSQPVYLSRTKFQGARTIRYEPDVEEMMSKSGAIAIYPENLSLDEHVYIFNRYRHFIGCWGSAFHSLAFSLDPHLSATEIISDGSINMNFLMFDAINGNKANYIDCMKATPGLEQNWPNLNLEIDLEKFSGYITQRKHLTHSV